MAVGGAPTTLRSTTRPTSSLAFRSTPASALPCPAGRSGPWSRRTGAPEASATGRDRTSVRAGPWDVGTRGVRAVTNSRQGFTRTAGQRPSNSRSLNNASGRIRLWYRRPPQQQASTPRELEGSFHSAAECRVVKLDLAELVAFRGVEDNPNRDAVSWVDPFEERL